MKNFFGMSLMGSSLQKLAGGSLEKILEALTTGRRKGAGVIKGRRAAGVAVILIGLRLLFYGMTMMEEIFESLRDMSGFQRMFISFGNPLFGIFVGVVLTAVIQSTSAAVGILRALSASGGVIYATALPFLLGQNIRKMLPDRAGRDRRLKKGKACKCLLHDL